ncbi:MAG: hypothetical protein IJ801_10025 [Lachnospiraceae bacterium]|nr:hypothetical protein [Lachnospiraceae bacterium]
MTYKDWKKAFVDGKKSGLKEANPSDTINHMDITKEWTKKNKAGSVVEKLSYIVDNVTYVVDGKHVILQPSEQERRIAVALSEQYGKLVELVPQIMYPLGKQTPDYLIDGERYDLKAPTGKGKYLLQGLIAKKQLQSHNFVIDITECPLDMSELERQVNDLFRSPRTSFLNTIVFIKDGKVIKVLQRHN